MLVIKNILITNEDVISQKLLKIPGIGPDRLKEILHFIGISKSCELSNLSIKRQDHLKTYIELYYGDSIGDALREKIKENIKFYVKLKSYRGIRHQYSLPVRGQNTRTNARTRKRQRGNVKKKIFVIQKKNRKDKYRKHAKPKKRKRSRKKRTGKI